MDDHEFAFALVFAYLLVYYPFQSVFSSRKLTSWVWLLKPGMVILAAHIICGVVVADLAELFLYLTWIFFDGLAIYVWPQKGGPLFRFGLTQVVRFGSIILFSRLAVLPAAVIQTIAGVPYFQILAVISGWLLVGYFAGDLVGILMKPFSPPEKSGLSNGGMVIGILERSILYLLLLLNSPGGIGFLITAKTLFRFGEISAGGNNRLQVEYILIGSLMSFFVGGVISVAWMFLVQSFFPGMPFKLLGG